jgi:hypothetical protein
MLLLAEVLRRFSISGRFVAGSLAKILGLHSYDEGVAQTV